MDHIRNTMMQHEALFKEQDLEMGKTIGCGHEDHGLYFLDTLTRSISEVQALHKLYNIQRSAMQEIRRRIHPQAQVLAFNSGSVAVGDDQFRGSFLEGKPLRPAFAAAQAYKEESLASSLHPFYALKEFKGCGSVWMDDSGVKTFHTAQSKPMRNFDLEKLPEDYTDESEIQVVSNSSDSMLSKRTPIINKNSFVGGNLSVIQVDSPSSKQTYPKRDLRILSVPSQEINQGASEGKVCGVDNKECTVGFQNLNDITKNSTSEEFPQNDLPAVGNYHADVDSNPSDNHYMDKPTLLRQVSLVFTTQRSEKLHLERNQEQAKGSIVPGPTQLQQYLESNSAILTTHLKLEEQRNGNVGGGSCQGSSTLEPVHCEPKNPNDFFIQRSLSLESNSVSGKQNLHSFALTSETSINGGNENPNDSGDGSNSIQSRDTRSCKDKSTSIHTKASLGCGDDCCEPGQMSHGKGEVVQSEIELPQFINDGTKPSLSSALSNSALSDGEPKTVACSEHLLVTESNEDPKDKSALDEACESIAAEILLSFAPSRSWVDSQSHGTPTDAELGKSNRENTSSDKQWNLLERRYTNYSNGSGINESIKWTKSVHRRTLRRPR